MKIYVVESLFDYTTQFGFSTSRKVAEQKMKEIEERDKEFYPNCHHHFWIEEYSEGKELWADFNGD